MPRNFKQKQATPLVTVPLVGPGFRGLNTELANAEGFIESDWAAVLDNVVFDDLGRIALRKGYDDVTGTPAGSTAVDMHHVHEYLREDGTVSIIAVTEEANPRIWESTDDGDTWTNITGDLAGVLVNLNMQFANFNDDLYVAAAGHKVHQYNTAGGSFTEVGSQVTSGSIVAAYGRLWASRDASSTVDYCALLDGTDWVGASAGAIDASNAWTDGQDEITALFAFGASFYIFGKRQILIYVDGAGSVLGIDPENMYVVDTIEGTGTVHRDSVINIGEGDLWWLGPQGVQSLSRSIQDKVNPMTDVSNNVKSLIEQLIGNQVGAAASVKAIFSPKERFVLYLFPESNTVLGFDTRFQLDDGTYRVFTWTTAVPYYSGVARRNNDILFGLDDSNLGKYAGYRDDAATYNMTYASPWLNFGQEAHLRLKILKSAYAYIYGRGTISGTARWGVDFRPLEFSLAVSNAYTASGAEWGSGEWGSGEFGDGHRMRKEEMALWNQGQFIKIYLQLQSDIDDKIALQELAIRAKLGRGV